MTVSTQDCILRCQHENWSPFICADGKDHCPRTSQRRKQIKEWLFSAAAQGCKLCVQHCLEVMGLNVDIQSDNKKFTVMDWAQWAVDNDVYGAQEVVSYLISEWKLDLPWNREPSRAEMYDVLCFDDIPFEGGRHLCKSHKPKYRQDDPRYWFFNAVLSGCKYCVAFCVHRHGLNKDVKTDAMVWHPTTRTWKPHPRPSSAADIARENKDAEMLFFLDKLDCPNGQRCQQYLLNGRLLPPNVRSLAVSTMIAQCLASNTP